MDHMPGTSFEINPATHITTGYIGQPGKRVFYLQAASGEECITLILEKMQVEALAQGLTQFTQELASKFPDLAPPQVVYQAERMQLITPVDPVFRIGQLGLGYDADRDLIVMVAQEIVVEGRDPAEVASARFFATREQMLTLVEHSQSIVKQGRATCGLCGQPIDPEGHFCPRSNGHKH